MSTLGHSIRVGARLPQVVRHIAAASKYPPLTVYVERRGAIYRWSPAHRGGPYPLLRVTARLMGIDHHQFVLPFRSHGDLCIVPAADSEAKPDAWTVLQLDRPTTPAQLRAQIAAALPGTALAN